MMKDKLFILVGPTAIGKTALSIDLAKRLKGKSFLLIPCKSINIWI